MNPNSSKKHGIQTFSFRRAKHSDVWTQVYETKDGKCETLAMEQLKHPILVLHRNHSPAPVELDCWINKRAARRYLKCKSYSLLYRYTQTTIGLGWRTHREIQHKERMNRDQAAAQLRREGVLR